MRREQVQCSKQKINLKTKFSPMDLSVYCSLLDFFFFRTVNAQKSASNYNILKLENNLFWNLSFIRSKA